MKPIEEITPPEVFLVTGLINYYRGEPYNKERVNEKIFNAWKELFRLYNSLVPPPPEFPNSRLGMGCRPCYTKVYLWYKGQLEKKDEDLEVEFTEPKEVIKENSWIYS